MFGRAISMEAWAEIHEDLELPTHGTVGSASIVTGEHPYLGAVVVVHTPEGVHIVSENPYQDEADRRLAADDEAVRTIVQEATRSSRRRFAPH